MQVTFFVLCIVFGLAIAQALPSTSPCSAISINLGNGNATVFGETLNAARYEFANNCNYGDSGTAWYSVTPPKGSSVVVSTCGEYTNFDTHLGLYSGSCDSLTCMVGNDDGDCPHIDGLYTSMWTTFSSLVPGYDPVETRYDPSTIQWVADGSTYFVAVSGDEEEGKFTLSFVTLSSNGGCVHAEKIPGPYSEIPIVHNKTLPGDNVGVTNCGHISYDTPAAWFTIYPEPGKLMNVTTCGTQFDTRLAVVAGDCSDLTCLFQNDDSDCMNYASTIQFWPTLAEYFVVVMGYSHSSVGQPFVLSVSQDTQELDQSCISAFPFHVSDSFLAPEASTVNAMAIETPLCSNEAGPAVWFKVTNQRYAAQVTFTTCTPVTDFETVLTAYSGNCSSLSCKASTSSDCSGNGSSITVDLASYEQFYLVVSGVNGQTGNFQIETDSFISVHYISPISPISPTTFYG